MSLSLFDSLRNFADLLINSSNSIDDIKPFGPLLNLFNIDSNLFVTLSLGQKWFRINKFFIQELLNDFKIRSLIDKCKPFISDPLINQLVTIYNSILQSMKARLQPFWNDSIQSLSDKLWMPSFDSVSFQPLSKDSWFSIQKSSNTLNSNFLTSKHLSDTYFSSDPSENINVLRARTIKLHITSEQEQIFNQWLGVSRFLYNSAIDNINLSNDNSKYSKSDFRKNFVTNVYDEWQKDVPACIRDNAVLEAYDALNSAMGKYKKTHINFELGYKSKKDDSQIINLSNDCLKNGFRLFPKILGNNSAILIYESEKKHFKFKNKTTNIKTDKLDEHGNVILNEKGKPEKINSGKTKNHGAILAHEFKIQKLRTGDWYLIVPLDVEIKSSENQGTIISLDPGVRTFLTGYSPDGDLYKFGEGDMLKNFKNLLKTDKLNSKITKLKGKKKYRHRKALKRRNEKTRNRMKDCHRKIVKYLVENYDTIILPKFESKGMSKRSERKINTKTVRNMYGWSHYKFRMMLISKIQEYKNKNIIFPTEEYTSKTCTGCGNIKKNLGGAKIYKCSKCGLKVERDITGSRNILLKSCSNK